jgi:D-sedoheptulose 7-phosphate isomerase
MKHFFRDYFNKINELLLKDEKNLKNLEILSKELVKIKNNDKKVIVIGNGGSAAIASHFALDLTNVAKIKCISFSDISLATCLSNDFGYENFYLKAINMYGDKGDMLIAISSSGMSKNIINAAKNSKLKNIVTFTGFSEKNLIRKIGKLNFYVNSYSYNIVETIHQIFLLTIVDKLKVV